MHSDLPAGTQAQIQTLAAKGRTWLEPRLFRRPSMVRRVRIALLRGAGAIAIGIFAAGASILATVIILNLVVHYIPS
jgi:hypothetical protein